MADDQDALASKILLLRASNKSRARAWLSSSLPANQKDEPETQDDIPDIHGDNENSGIGVSKKDVGDDDFSNRQLLSANDALRKKLLSRDAYKRYQQGSKGQLEASKPMPKQAKKREDIESEDEGKGRSAKGRKSQQKLQVGEVVNPPAVSAGPPTTSIAPSNNKKRPSSYLDQLLAERGRKKQKSKKES